MEAVSCVYVPMDGMNEKGLYIANLQNDTVPVMPAEGDTVKKYVQTTVAIRYILDKAATVHEAEHHPMDYTTPVVIQF